MQMLKRRTTTRPLSESTPVRLMSTELCSGDRLSQPEFHRRYMAYPTHVKFELVQGVVYMASPMRRPHGLDHVELSYLLKHYSAATVGTEVLDNTTAILDEDSEPQPDLCVCIQTEFGGQSSEDAEGYMVGAPELVAEIAHSSRAIDLFEKRDDYRKAGVREYLVLCVAERELHWFHFPSGEMIRPEREGISRSREFPGLWIDVAALMARDTKRLRAALDRGLARREHAAFCRRLKDARKKSS
ncbi:MAG TPA: Uma2 family endonuclease [Planctomycetaceae bacterium]|nr:Uma2 family endonuclease [Planctomycetaceae bacterium]